MNASLRDNPGSIMLRRLPAWLGIGVVLSGLFASSSSFLVGVSFWSALPAAFMAVFLNLGIMLPLLYGGILLLRAGSFAGTLARIVPVIMAAQVPAGAVNAWLIEYLFPYMMLANWWVTFAMLTGTALAVCCLATPLTIHYEELRGELGSPPEEPAEAGAIETETGTDAAGRPDTSAPEPGLWIPEDSGRRLVRFDDILYLTSRGHSTIIHTDRRDYKRSVLMKRLGTRLPSDGFMRVHKSHMINLKRVDRMEYFMGGAYIAFLNDEAETEVPVGRTYAAALKSTLGI